MSTKDVSKSSYQWGHFGAIMFDVIVLAIIAFFAYRSRQLIGYSGKTSIKRSRVYFNLSIIFWLSIIVSIITLFGLIPVFQNYERIIIS